VNPWANFPPPIPPLLPATNLAASLPALPALFPAASLSQLPDVSVLLKSGQSPALQDPLQQLGFGSNPFSSAFGAVPGANPFGPAPPISALNEERRTQLLQLIKLRSDRIASLQKYVEQGQNTVLRLNQQFTDWLAAEKQKGETQLALQKTSLQTSEKELDALIKAQQSDVTEVNNYNVQLKKAYIDSGLQIQKSRLQKAQADEAKQKEEYERTQKNRKDIETQVADLDKELKAAGGSAAASTSSTGAGAPATTPSPT
jgi:hypothetical protein